MRFTELSNFRYDFELGLKRATQTSRGFIFIDTAKYSEVIELNTNTN